MEDYPGNPATAHMSMEGKKKSNLLFWFIRDATEYITIDRTPRDDGNRAYCTEIEDLFSLYKQWYIREEVAKDGSESIFRGHVFSQTLQFAEEFRQNLDCLCWLWNKAELPEIPYMAVMPHTLMPEGYGTWVIGMKPVKCAKRARKPSANDDDHIDDSAKKARVDDE